MIHSEYQDVTKELTVLYAGHGVGEAERIGQGDESWSFDAGCTRIPDPENVQRIGIEITKFLSRTGDGGPSGRDLFPLDIGCAPVRFSQQDGAVHRGVSGVARTLRGGRAVLFYSGRTRRRDARHDRAVVFSVSRADRFDRRRPETGRVIRITVASYRPSPDGGGGDR